MDKTIFGILFVLLLLNFVGFSDGLTIDPFVTHNQINKTIDAKLSFSFSFDEIEPNRRLGFQIQSYSKDVLRVQITDENHNPVNAFVNYNFDNGVTFINSEFEPQDSEQYNVVITNLDEGPVQVTGTYGIMLSIDEVNEIIQRYEGTLNQSYDQLPSFLIIGFVGGSVGIIIGFFLFRKKNQS